MKKASLLSFSILLMFTLISCSKDSAVPQDTSSKDSLSTSTSTFAHESSEKFDKPQDNKGAIPSLTSQNQETQAQAQVLDLYERGLKLYFERKFNEALNLFNQALALDSQSYQALNAKGATYAFQGRYNEGIALIQQSIQLKPDFAYSRFNLGLAYELAGNYDESIKSYLEAIKLDDKDVWSYYGIASIYGRKGDVEKVIEWLSMAINLDPEVKAVAREEKDFIPVRNDPRFESLIKAK